MRYIVHDKKYSFKYAFDTLTGAYIRTGILDEEGRDTGVDPFVGSYPHLIDTGIMGHCIHGGHLMTEIVVCDSNNRTEEE